MFSQVLFLHLLVFPCYIVTYAELSLSGPLILLHKFDPPLNLPIHLTKSVSNVREKNGNMKEDWKIFPRKIPLVSSVICLSL